MLVVLLEKQTVKEPSPTFAIETVSSTCMSEPHDLEISAEGKSIVITAPLFTPNPCYSVTGDVRFNGRNVDVDLTPVYRGGVCIQCLGEVTGKVVIQNLSAGSYNVKVTTTNGLATTIVRIE